MHMLYNSDSYAVVQFEATSDSNAAATPTVERGGYEIVDKFARKEIFLQGPMAVSFREGVDALIRSEPSEEEMDAYIERFSVLMLHPLVLH